MHGKINDRTLYDTVVDVWTQREEKWNKPQLALNPGQRISQVNCYSECNLKSWNLRDSYVPYGNKKTLVTLLDLLHWKLIFRAFSSSLSRFLAVLHKARKLTIIFLCFQK